jgi:hypothetical protein
MRTFFEVLLTGDHQVLLCWPAISLLAANLDCWFSVQAVVYWLEIFQRQRNVPNWSGQVRPHALNHQQLMSCAQFLKMDGSGASVLYSFEPATLSNDQAEFERVRAALDMEFGDDAASVASIDAQKRRDARLVHHVANTILGDSQKALISNLVCTWNVFTLKDFSGIPDAIANVTGPHRSDSSSDIQNQWGESSVIVK